MRPDEIEIVRMVVHARSGVSIDPHKTYSIESHLGPVARREGYAGVDEMVQAMRVKRDEGLMWAVTEALIPGETCFFRDREPFALFRDVLLPDLAARGLGEAKVWSAACATGQEAYSLAMSLDEVAGELGGLKVDFLGTDLSERRLEKAQSGVYTQFEIQRGLPIRQLLRHFEKVDDVWRIDARLRETIRWRRVNLLADLRPLGRFDIIYCRYAVGDLDPALRGRVLEQLARALNDDGRLVLGKGETAEAAGEALQPDPRHPGLFVRNPAFRAAA